VTRSRAGRNCARECARELGRHVLKIGRAHDVVAIEHGARPVPGDLHRHPLGHACIVVDGLANQAGMTPEGSECRSWLYEALLDAVDHERDRLQALALLVAQQARR
jgi:hypothetical protein